MNRRIFALIAFLMLIPPCVLAGSPVVAVVNGKSLTERDLEEAVDKLIPRATFHGGITAERRAEFRQEALEDLISRELQHQDALARGMKPDKQQVKAQMKQVRDSFSSSGEYRRWLEQAGLTEDLLREKIEKELLIQAAAEAIVVEPSRMSDKALQDYYSSNISKFRQPESIRLRIISAQEEKKIRDILIRLRAGEDFGNIAARMSEDNYRIKGGDIGYIHRGRIYPALEAAAFRLKAGEISDPVRAEGKWFIVKLEGRQPERQVPFEEAKAKLRTDLEKKRMSELREQWLTGLQAKASIERKLQFPSAQGLEHKE